MAGDSGPSDRQTHDEPAGTMAVSLESTFPSNLRLPGYTFMKNEVPRFFTMQWSSEAGIRTSLEVWRKCIARTFCQPIASLDLSTDCGKSTDRSFDRFVNSARL